MIEISRLHFTKADLATVSREQRALIFLTGHTINLVNVWVKLIRASSSSEPPNDIESRLGAAQTQILLRALFGTLHEAWQWQQRREMGPLIQRYLPNCPPDIKQSRKSLSQRLGNGGLLKVLRDGFSYHHPSMDALDTAFLATPDGEDWSWYVTDELSSSFYLSCELVVSHGAAGVAGDQDLNAGFKKVVDEAIAVANDMNTCLWCGY